MRRLDRIDMILEEIRSAGYSVTRDGQVVYVSHPKFSKALPLSISKLRSGVVAGLNAYRRALR
jgi:hypothetical protein